jgi:hypothetical protein
VLKAALQAPQPQIALAVVLVLTTVISAGYYLYVVMVMFMRPRTPTRRHRPRRRRGRSSSWWPARGDPRLGDRPRRSVRFARSVCRVMSGPAARVNPPCCIPPT